MISSETLFTGFLKLTKDTLRCRNDSACEYLVVSSAPASVAIIAMTARKEILLTREYRHAVAKTVIGLPGGNLNDGEDPVEGAKRELIEETGYSAKNWHIIGSTHPLPGIFAHTTHIVFAECISLNKHKQLEDSEFIESYLCPYDNIVETLSSRNDLDGIMLQALCLYSASASVRSRKR